VKKIPCVFKKDDSGRVINEVNPGCEWVLAGEGVATDKFDGTACMVRDGVLHKRYNRKPNRQRRKAHVPGNPWHLGDFKPAPEGWEQCQEPDVITGHWPGWMPVGDEPESKYHREIPTECLGMLDDGTYELIGPKVQGNPYGLRQHMLVKHGSEVVGLDLNDANNPFYFIQGFLSIHNGEGIVFHHPDGRMAKITRKHYGYTWPKETDGWAE